MTTESCSQYLNSKTEKNSVGQKNENPIDSTNLYIKGLWKDCTQLELDDLFKPFGVIRQSRVYGDGIGFVRYELPHQATAAIKSLNGKKFCRNSEQPLMVRLAHKKPRLPKSVIEMGEKKIEMLVHENTKNVYIRGLPPYYNESELYLLCSQFGNISCIRLCRNGVAFVRFSNCSQACNAIHSLHGKCLPNCCTPLLVKLANSDPFEPRVEFRPHMNKAQEHNGSLISSIQQQNSQIGVPDIITQMTNSLNNVNMINLGNSLTNLNLNPNIANLSNIRNPQLQSQLSNTSANSLNLNLLCVTNNNGDLCSINKDIFGLKQQLLSPSLPIPVVSQIDLNGTSNQNIQKDKVITTNNDKIEQNEEDDGNDEIVYLGYEDEEHDTGDDSHESENKSNSISPKTSNLEKSKCDFSSTKNSISTGEITNNASFRSSISSVTVNSINPVPSNNFIIPTLQTNINSNNKQNNNLALINLNSFGSVTPVCNLNYTNWPQNNQLNNQIQPQPFRQGTTTLPILPGLISMPSNSSQISNVSGNLGYFPMQQIQLSQTLTPNFWNNDNTQNGAFLSFVPVGENTNNTSITSTSNLNFPINLPLLQNSNSFQFYVPNQINQ